MSRNGGKLKNYKEESESEYSESEAEVQSSQENSQEQIQVTLPSHEPFDEDIDSEEEIKVVPKRGRPKKEKVVKQPQKKKKVEEPAIIAQTPPRTKRGMQNSVPTPSVQPQRRTTPKFDDIDEEKEVVIGPKPKQIGIDFGASKFLMRREGPNQFATEPVSTLYYREVDQAGNVWYTADSDVDVNTFQKEKLIEHLKLKFPFLLNRAPLRIQVLNNNTRLEWRDATREQIFDIFVDILEKLILSSQDDLDLEKIHPDQEFLISIPNTYSMIQKHKAQEWWENALERIITSRSPGWKPNGRVTLYTEVSCALCWLIEHRPTEANKGVVIIDQGDSTTNMATCYAQTANGKVTYTITEYGLSKGGNNYTTTLCNYAANRVVSLKKDVPEMLVRLKCRQRAQEHKERLLGTENSVVCVGESSRMIQIPIESATYKNECQKIDAEICKEINTFLDSNARRGISNVVCVGGGMRNKCLQDAIHQKCFSTTDQSKWIIDGGIQRVCSGLFARHRVEQKKTSYNLNELSPASFYLAMVSVSEEKPAEQTIVLEMILSKGVSTYTRTDLSVSIPHRDVIDLRIYQLDQNEETIIYGKKLDEKQEGGISEDLMMQQAGTLTLDKKNLRGARGKTITLTLITTYVQGKLKFSCQYNNIQLGVVLDGKEHEGEGELRFSDAARKMKEQFTNLKFLKI